MSTTNSLDSQPNLNVPIKSSKADRVNAILIACLVMFGFLFSVLLMLWWFHEPTVGTYLPPPPHPTKPAPTLPVVDDLDLVEFESSEGKAFEELVTTVTPSLVKFTDADGLKGDGVGSIPGKGRDPHPLPFPISGDSAPQWSVVQAANDLESYQLKLDFFGIEIGAVHKTRDQVWRIAKLSTEKIVTESTRSAESRLRYFVNRKKRLQQWDLQTISQAGVDLQDVIAVHFYPDKLVADMQQLIDNKYSDRSSELQEVTFKITGTPGDFRFEIVDAKFGN